MSYLMGEMLIYFLAIALLGIIVGWLFTKASYRRKVEDAEVVLLGQLHDSTQQLDMTQRQLEETTGLLEQERSHKTVNFTELQKAQADLSSSKSEFDDRNQEVIDLNRSLDEATQQAQHAKDELEKQLQENQKMKRDFDAIQSRLFVFQSDLDEIVKQSSILRTAFEKARLDVVAKDKRISELESISLESISNEGLQMAALGNNGEPELALSRIARLQTRVQELFDEVSEKDKQIENLKNLTTVNEPSSSITKISDLQADDLQQIGGIGGELEDKLNKMGITHFSDIATWDDSDIERFDQEFNFHGRIRQENWVEQAQRLNKPIPPKYRS